MSGLVPVGTARALSEKLHTPAAAGISARKRSGMYVPGHAVSRVDKSKSRATDFSTIHRYLDGADAVIVKADRRIHSSSFDSHWRRRLPTNRDLWPDDDETNNSLHTNIAYVTVHSSVSMWDTAQSVAV